MCVCVHTRACDAFQTLFDPLKVFAEEVCVCACVCVCDCVCVSMCQYVHMCVCVSK